MCWHGAVAMPRRFESEMEMCTYWEVSTNQAVQLGSSLLVSALADPVREKVWGWSR